MVRVDRYIAEGDYLFSLYLLIGFEGYQDFLAMSTGTVQETT